MTDAIGADEARRILDEEKAFRIREAMKAIEKVLSEFHCQLVAAPRISADGRIVTSIVVESK